MLKLQYQCSFTPVLNSNAEETKITRYPLITIESGDDDDLEYATIENIVDTYFVPFLQAMGYTTVERLYTDKQVEGEIVFAEERIRKQYEPKS
jgi:hypothetical protein